MSGEYGECGKTSNLSVFKYFFTTLATWGRALSWRRIILSCLCSYSGRFSRNAQLKRINYNRYQSLVNRQVSTVHSKQDPFGPIRYRAWSSNHECWCWCWDGNDWPGLVFFFLGIVVEYPLLISSHNPMQKNLFSLNQLFASKKSPFNVSRFQFIRHAISLFLNHSHDSQSYRNGLLSYSQWFCKLLLRLTLIFFE